MYNKFLIMRKATAYLIEGPQLSSLMNDYYLKFIDKPTFNPG